MMALSCRSASDTSRMDVVAEVDVAVLAVVLVPMATKAVVDAAAGAFLLTHVSLLPSPSR